jgi:hypothetical protein
MLQNKTKKDLLCSGIFPTLFASAIILCNKVFDISIKCDHAADCPALRNVVGGFSVRINE